MKKVYNFSSGPAKLPAEVLVKIQNELNDWHKSGMSVMEMSHRGGEFAQILNHSENSLRQLLDIPNNYRVLFLSGSASLQFAAIPLNLLGGAARADYLDIGIWSQKAIKEAEKYCKVNIVASSSNSNYTHVPEEHSWRYNSDAAYLHITGNETIGGVEMFFSPQAHKLPLVADMSSNILSRPININEYAMIYAGAQKNIGPAGMTIVIIRDDLLGHALPITPTILNYQIQADNHSLYNTPNTFAVYTAGLVFDWLHDNGGLLAMEKRNIEKANLLYNYIDTSDFYHNNIALANRSRMNVTFRLEDESYEEQFVRGADERGLYQLRGHRSVGGMRASIYNAMPIEGVQALIDYMQDFADTL